MKPHYMKSLYESILSKSNVGIVKIGYDEKANPPLISDVYVHTTLQDYLDTKKLYEDAYKIKGDSVNTHAEAFGKVLSDTVFKKKDFESMLTDDPAANSATDKLLRKIFAKYIKKSKKFNFYCNKSPWYNNTYEIGILDHEGRLDTKRILQFRTK